MRAFTTIYINNGIAQNLVKHLNRINAYNQAYNIAPITMPELLQKLENIPTSGKWRGRLEYDTTGLLEITITAFQPRIIEQLYIVHNDNIVYNHKYVNREIFNKLRTSVCATDTEDIIIVKNGLVTDSSYANLVFQDYNNRYFTPKDCLLPGTCRAGLLEGTIVKASNIRVEDIANFKYVHLVNTFYELEALKIECAKIATT